MAKFERGVTAPFGGIFPILEPDKLPPGAAQICQNVNLRSGGLNPFRVPLKIYEYAKTGTVLSAYRMYNGANNYWLHWTTDVDAVRGPVSNLSDFRLYYTGDSAGEGWPKKTNLTLATGSSNYPADYLEMGVPPPPGTFTLSGGAGVVVRTYVITFVNSWGVGGPPSAPVTGTYDSGTWTLDSIPLAPGSPYSASSKWGIAKRRIYRAFTNAAGETDYYFVKELGDNTTTTTTDAVTDAVLVTQGTIPTYEFGIVNSEWMPPPTGLKGLCLGHNGIMAGFYDNFLCFSEPFNPEAWPVRYQIALPQKIVAIIPFLGQFIVASEGPAYIVTGNHPRSMSRTPVPRDDMACVSKRSAAKTPFGAMFATTNGYAVVGNGPAEHITDNLIGAEKWRGLYSPATMIAAAWENRVALFYQTGESRAALLLDQQNKKNPLSELGVEVQGTYVDPVNNKLYLLRSDGIYEWEGDQNNLMNMDWLSGIDTYPKPCNLAVFRADAKYADLGGNFAEEQAQIVADEATNDATLAALPTETYPGPATIKDATGCGFPTGGFWARAGDAITQFAPGPNGNCMPTGGSLMIGGVFSTFINRGLVMQWLAWNERTSTMQVRHSKTLTEGKRYRLPGGYLSDKVALRLSGNLVVTTFKAASKGTELEQI